MSIRTKVGSGSDFAASPHRETVKTYVSDRSLDSLKKLGIDEKIIEVAKRGDEILDPGNSLAVEQPKVDGKLRLAELDRLDKPANWQALFPEERAAVASVHKLFEIPPPPSGERTSAVLPGITYSPAGAYDASADRVAIESLPPDLRVAAQRVQLVKDDDQNSTTISRADIDWALQAANAGRFTASTLDALRRVAAALPTEGPLVVGHLPSPRQITNIFEDAGVRIDLTASLSLLAGTNRAPDGMSMSFVRLDVGDRELSVSAPPGHKVLLKAIPSEKGVGARSAAVDFFEHVSDSTSERLSFVPGLKSGTLKQLWVQVVNESGEVVANQRIHVPWQKVEVPEIPPELRGKPVAEWRDWKNDIRPYGSAGAISDYVRADRYLAGVVFARGDLFTPIKTE